jgi:hypothetical protein
MKICLGPRIELYLNEIKYDPGAQANLHSRATITRRSHVKRLALMISLATVAGLLAIPSAYAALDYPGNIPTTDLNLIPITDTLKAGTMEWDLQARYNQDSFNRGRRVSTRLFCALFDNFEFGMAWDISRPAGPVMFAAKYKVLDEYSDFPVSLAVGAEGVTGNWQRTERDPTYYAVVGVHDVHIGGWWDWYVGVNHNPTGYDNEDNSLFGGFKYWINKEVQFNADYYGYSDNEENIISAGLNYDWINHIGFQGWVERDSVTEDNVFVLQLAVRGDMRKLTDEVSDPE